MKITREDLKKLISEPYASRGKDISRSDVTLEKIKDDYVRGRVNGSDEYTIRLYKSFSLSGHCTCPAFENYGPCKHMMAVGLAVIHHNLKNASSPEEKLRRSIEEMSKKELVDLIMKINYKVNLTDFIKDIHLISSSSEEEMESDTSSEASGYDCLDAYGQPNNSTARVVWKPNKKNNSFW